MKSSVGTWPVLTCISCVWYSLMAPRMWGRTNRALNLEKMRNISLAFFAVPSWSRRRAVIRVSTRSMRSSYLGATKVSKIKSFIPLFSPKSANYPVNNSQRIPLFFLFIKCSILHILIKGTAYGPEHCLGNLDNITLHKFFKSAHWFFSLICVGKLFKLVSNQSAKP